MAADPEGVPQAGPGLPPDRKDYTGTSDFQTQMWQSLEDKLESGETQGNNTRGNNNKGSFTVPHFLMRRLLVLSVAMNKTSLLCRLQTQTHHR